MNLCWSSYHTIARSSYYSILMYNLIYYIVFRYLAAMAGIQVFVTGGIGGVHR